MVSFAYPRNALAKVSLWGYAYHSKPSRSTTSVETSPFNAERSESKGEDFEAGLNLANDLTNDLFDWCSSCSCS